jgi:hypothetical protein
VSEPDTFDVTRIPELARLARGVHTSKRPVRLTDAEGTVAVLMPYPPAARSKRPRRRIPTDEDLRAFRAAAGSWKGNVDAGRLVEGLAESRRIPPRPLTEL